MSEDIKTIRRAQTITPFGVGSVLDIEGESLVTADITRWKGNGVIINEPRLERYLGVRRFKMAPPAPEYHWKIDESTPGVPFVRFPTWLFCANCRTMYQRFSRRQAPECPSCAGIKLTPMRFVMACPRGHLADVPWDYWVHSDRIQRCEKSELEFYTEPGGSGLEFVYVHCRSCNAKRNLSGITVPDSLSRSGIRCPGHHPWVSWKERDKNCDAIPQVLQRGATNLTFGIVESSIDIPPFSRWKNYSSDTIEVTNDMLFPAIRTAWESGQQEMVDSLIEMIANRQHRSISSVRSIVFAEIQGQQPEKAPQLDPEILLQDEYGALTATDITFDPRDRFIKRDIDLTGYPYPDSPKFYKTAVNMLKSQLGRLVQVTKLREVRALRGFSRLSPPEGAADIDEEPPGRFSLYGSDKKVAPILVPADLGSLPPIEKWLPAIEVYGEGIFLSLDEEALQEWEYKEPVVQRVAPLVQRRKESAAYLPVPSPRLVLLHTLSHILIRQLSFEAGYSISSMRERIYASSSEGDQEPMAGILIYTAAGDSEGTLGGLVRQGEVDRMLPVIVKSLQTAEWCSSDPLCRESRGQGLHALNLAACHACSLLPETSCVMSNRLLDRIMLVGSGDGKTPGYFGDLLDYLLASTQNQ